MKFRKISAVFIVLLLCFCCLSAEIPIKIAAADEVPVALKNNGTMRYYYNDAVGNQFWTESGSFSVDGVTAICCEHDKSQPWSQTVYRSVIKNAELAKVLYYGTVEKAIWSGFTSKEERIVVTSLLVDAIYNGTTPKGITKAFRAFLETAPPAPTPYIFRYRTTSTSYQDLVGYVSEFEQGSISVKKVDPSGKGLAWAVFRAVNQETGLIISIGPTDSTGYASTRAVVPYGTYKITETTAPAGYKLSTETWTVNVAPENNGVASFTAVNEADSATVTVIKTSSDGRKKDVSFTLTGGSLTEPRIGKTDSAGKLVFDNLEPGTYTVTETVPDKYVPQAPQTVTVDIGQIVTVHFNNIVKKGTIKGIKVDENGKALAGALIGLFYANETHFVSKNVYMEYTTNADGSFIFADIPYGDYIVLELAAPEGYILSNEKYPAKVAQDGDIVEIKIVNEFERVDVEVRKSSEDQILEGFRFRLYGTSKYGTQVEMFATTDINGIAVFKNVPLAETKYTVEEIDTPERYIEPAAQKVSTFSKVNYLFFDNNLKRGTVKGIKVDEKDKPLAGALIGLFADDETEFTSQTALQTAITAEDGSFEFTEILYGEYVAREIAAPEGYVLNDERYPVKVEQDGDVVELKIINTPQSVEIHIVKTDAYGNTLAGAIFTLEISNNEGLTYETYSQLITNDTGLIKFKELAPGKYYRITETKAPDGFQLLAEPVFEGILEVGIDEPITYTVVNIPIFELPATGGNSFTLTTISLITAMTMIFVVTYMVCSKKSKQSK